MARVRRKPDQTVPSRLKSSGIALMLDQTDLASFINRTSSLTDEQYEAEVHALGSRVALWKQRAGALTGDVALVKACETYLARVAQFRASRPRAKAKDAVAPASVASFIQPVRSRIDEPQVGQAPDGEREP